MPKKEAGQERQPPSEVQRLLNLRSAARRRIGMALYPETIARNRARIAVLDFEIAKARKEAERAKTSG